jgi:mRNA interferase MazF
MEMVIERFSVHLVTLDPTVGREIRKTRPCVVVSPDEMNRHLSTVIVAPMTTTKRGYPTRIVCDFSKKSGEIALDQMRAVDQSRLVKHLGRLDAEASARVVKTLVTMFC